MQILQGTHMSEQGTAASWRVNQAALIGQYNVTILASTDMKYIKKMQNSLDGEWVASRG